MIPSAPAASDRGAGLTGRSADRHRTHHPLAQLVIDRQRTVLAVPRQARRPQKHVCTISMRQPADRERAAKWDRWDSNPEPMDFEAESLPKTSAKTPLPMKVQDTAQQLRPQPGILIRCWLG